MAGQRKYFGPCPAHAQHTVNCKHCKSVARDRLIEFGERVERSWERPLPEKHAAPIYAGLHWSAPRE